jgi:hypothetical protein
MDGKPNRPSREAKKKALDTSGIVNPGTKKRGGGGGPAKAARRGLEEKV